MTKRLYLLLLLVWLFLQVGAQQTGVRNFSTIDAGAGKQNWAIDQDEAGRMLFANNNGLLVYDGDKWTTYPIANYTMVRCVKYDARRKVIYAGASDEFGYYKADGPGGRLIYHSLSSRLPKRDRFFGEVWQIEVSGAGVTFQTKSIAFAVSGDLRQVRRQALTLPYAHWRGADLLRGKTIRAVLPLQEKQLVVTATSGLFIYDGQSVKPYPSPLTPYLMSHEVFCAATNGQALAFGTVTGGVVAQSLVTGKTFYANIATGLMNNTVLSLYFDNTSNLWLGLDNGVALTLPYMPFLELFATPYTSIGTGYASLLYNGLLYLGTNQGLYSTRLTPESSPTPLPRTAVSGINGQVWNLTAAGGTLLCGADKGAFVVNGTAAQPIAGLSGTWCFCPLRRHPGYILASDYQGLAVLRRNGAGYNLHARLSGFNESSGNLVEDADGTLWISHWQKGVFHFRLSDDLRRSTLIERFGAGKGLPRDVNNVVTLIGGRVCISAADGLYRYDARRRRLVRDSRLSGLFDSGDGGTLLLHETPCGDLWALKSGYLALAKKLPGGHWRVDSTSYRNLNRRLQIGMGAPGQLSGEQTLFNANTGFLLIDQRRRANRTTNRVFVREVTSQTRSRDSLVYTYAPGKPLPEIRLSHKLNQIKIEYVMPEYREERDVTYSVYMEGYDKGWSEPTYETSKVYKLGRGTYTFHVKATNLVTGQTSETQLKLHVSPAWYESWLAVIVYLLLLGYSVRYLSLWLKKRADRELQRVKRENEQKTIKMKNEQLETELKHRYSELADSTMSLVHKNDILQDIDAQLDTLSERVRREESKAHITQAINEIRHSIHDTLNDDANWNKFEENFNLVYDNFMVKLRERFPSLNKTDLKLCAYLRMDLSSKEMASLLNISVRSIETARYRLRKKLNLGAGENLTRFIQELGSADNEN